MEQRKFGLDGVKPPKPLTAKQKIARLGRKTLRLFAIGIKKMWLGLLALVAFLERHPKGTLVILYVAVYIVIGSIIFDIGRFSLIFISYATIGIFVGLMALAMYVRPKKRRTRVRKVKKSTNREEESVSTTSESITVKYSRQPRFTKIIIIVIIVLIILFLLGGLINLISPGCQEININDYPNGIDLGNGFDCVSFTLEDGQVSPWIHAPAGMTYNISAPGSPFGAYFGNGSYYYVPVNGELGPVARNFRFEAYQDNTNMTVSVKADY